MINRRQFNSGIVQLSLAAGARSMFAEGLKYGPTWPSLEAHKVPDWFQDAKLGIFIHWGIYSVPAWATPSGELGKVAKEKWFANNPYAEWYLNTLRIADSPTYKHHAEKYGKDFDYYRFAETFNKENAKWNPDSWAGLFQKAGARYVVLTTKHHDGFRLWQSKVNNPKVPQERVTAKRDLLGELTTAVRKHGMRMGTYYSGGLDWTFTSEPIRTMEDLLQRVPQSVEYARYADAHWRELIERYQPCVMWNDISYPKAGQIPQLFSEYYNKVPDGLINNRFGVKFADFTTPEYAKYDKIIPQKWEACRGLGFSFGYNQVEGPAEVIAADKLVALFVDIVSNNGNLLLNVGPKPDGTISDIQMDRLQKLGAWLGINGEGIFGSRPWVRAKATNGETDVRFTQKAGALYAFFLKGGTGKTLLLPGVKAAAGSKAQILGSRAELAVSGGQDGTMLTYKESSTIPESLALTVKITPAPQG
jgi:alpha-L-fucosidase